MVIMLKVCWKHRCPVRVLFWFTKTASKARRHWQQNTDLQFDQQTNTTSWDLNNITTYLKGYSQENTTNHEYRRSSWNFGNTQNVQPLFSLSCCDRQISDTWLRTLKRGRHNESEATALELKICTTGEANTRYAFDAIKIKNATLL